MTRRGLEHLATGDVGPADYLIDGGFAKHADIEWAHHTGIRLWCPAMKNKHGKTPMHCALRTARGWPIGGSEWPANWVG